MRKCVHIMTSSCTWYTHGVKYDLHDISYGRIKIVVVDGLVSDWPALRAGLLCCNFFGQPGSVFKFPPLLWVKLWVGWVGRGYTEISRYFPHRGLIGLLSSQRWNFCIHWDFRSPLNHQKCLYGMIFFASQSLILCVVYHSSPSSHVRSSLIGWLFILG